MGRSLSITQIATILACFVSSASCRPTLTSSADLVIATAAELEAMPEDEVPYNAFPGVAIKGVGLLELASLHSVLAAGALWTCL
jgi:hypothetical protein